MTSISQQAAATLSSTDARRHRVARWFYIGCSVFMILLSVVGFGPSIIDQTGRNAPLTPLVAAHGVVAGGWLLLFLGQAFLAASGRIAVHRRLGLLLGPVFATAMVVLTYLSMVEFGRREFLDLSGDLVRFPGTPQPGTPEARDGAGGLLWLVAEFTVLVGSGLLFRHRPEIHKRLMLLALLRLSAVPVVHLVGAATRRWPAVEGPGGVIGVALPILLLFASAIYDWISQRRIHPVSLWVPIVLFFAAPAVVLPSEAWRDFSTWLLRLE